MHADGLAGVRVCHSTDACCLQAAVATSVRRVHSHPPAAVPCMAAWVHGCLTSCGHACRCWQASPAADKAQLLRCLPWVIGAQANPITACGDLLQGLSIDCASFGNFNLRTAPNSWCGCRCLAAAAGRPVCVPCTSCQSCCLRWSEYPFHHPVQGVHLSSGPWLRHGAGPRHAPHH
jgi:hypothetical protein